MSTQGSITFPYCGKYVCIAIRHSADDLLPILLEHCKQNDVESLIDGSEPEFVCGVPAVEEYLERTANRKVGVGDTPIDALRDLDGKGGLPNFCIGVHQNYLRLTGGWLANWMDSEEAFHVDQGYPLQVINSPQGFRDISCEISNSI